MELQHSPTFSWLQGINVRRLFFSSFLFINARQKILASELEIDLYFGFLSGCLRVHGCTA